MIVCFGEILLRISPQLNGQWLTQNQFPFYVGGAELNVANALNRWGASVKYVTAVPDNYMAEEILSHLEERGIDTSGVIKSGSRIGLYYLPQGTDLKNAGVIYDRANSSFAELQPGQIDWNKVLENVSWFHFSAINPALSETAFRVCEEALRACKSKGIKVSIDLNYRAKLWQYGKQPIEVMPILLPYCDVVMGNLWAANQLLGISHSVSDEERNQEVLVKAAEKSMQQLQDKYSNVTTVAFTFRMHDHYFAALHHENTTTVSQRFVLTDAIDKVGSGDCFMGGLIYGLLNETLPQSIIDFCAAAAVGKMQEMGDSTNQSVSAIKNRIKNNGNNE